MPLDRLALIIVSIAATVGFAFWTVSAIYASIIVNPVLLVPVVLVILFIVYVVWRLLAERLNNPDEDRYDNMDH